MTHLPLVNFFQKAVALVAPDFFENGLESLETACHIIDRWTPPMPGKDLVLPLNGVVMQCRIPLEVDSQLQVSVPFWQPCRQLEETHHRFVSHRSVSDANRIKSTILPSAPVCSVGNLKPLLFAFEFRPRKMPGIWARREFRSVR